MHFAPIIAFDRDKHKWSTIGVIANSSKGAMLKVEHRNRLVHETPSYRSMEAVYNREFQEGFVSFYDIAPGEMSSHIVRLYTTDVDFISKYGKEMVRQGKAIRLGEVTHRYGEDIEAEMENLLREVMRKSVSSS